LWFERKAAVNGNALAKACSAFANTYGGLLVVGVPDDRDELVGTEIQGAAAEPELWVKDTLRGLVLPMPSFRARWLRTEGKRGLLLVLVEESSTTPHLLMRTGAIYVRNPKSSDPVPISDQGRLLDLVDRGRRAREAAERLARLLNQATLDPPANRLESLTVAATGVSADFRSRIFVPEMPERLTQLMWAGDEPRRITQEQRAHRWSQDGVVITRERWKPEYVEDGNEIEGFLVHRRGAAVLYRGFRPVPGEPDPLAFWDLHESTLRERLERALYAAREILLDCGAHGDLRFEYRLQIQGRRVIFDHRGTDAQEGGEVTVSGWTTFEANDVPDRVIEEIALGVGLGPTGTSGH
jgi:hypothetical protein